MHGCMRVRVLVSVCACEIVCGYVCHREGEGRYLGWLSISRIEVSLSLCTNFSLSLELSFSLSLCSSECVCV